MDCIFPQRIQKALNLPQIQNIYATLPKHKTASPWAKRKSETITEIVVHHSASTASLLAQANYHVNSRGWHTLSYHFVIDRGGIFQINDPLSITHHASGANTNSIAICVNWDLRLRPLNEFEVNAIAGLVMTLKELFPTIQKVSGHNEVGKRNGYVTECPVVSMNKLRGDITGIEQRIIYSESEHRKKEIMYRVANQVSFMYNLSNGKDQFGKETSEGVNWAQQGLLKLEREMIKLGILKELQ